MPIIGGTSVNGRAKVQQSRSDFMRALFSDFPQVVTSKKGRISAVSSKTSALSTLLLGRKLHTERCEV